MDEAKMREVAAFILSADVGEIQQVGYGEHRRLSVAETHDGQRLAAFDSGYKSDVVPFRGVAPGTDKVVELPVEEACQQLKKEHKFTEVKSSGRRVMPTVAPDVHKPTKVVVYERTFTKESPEKSGVHVPEVKPKPVETEITHEKPTGDSPDEKKPETPTTPSEPPETPTTETKGDIHGGSGAQDIPPPPPEQGEKTNPTTGQTTPAKFKETHGSSIRPTDGTERTAVAPRSEPASEQDRQSVTAPEGGEGQQNPNSGTVQP
jgi:hypothetical protein